MRRRPWQHHLAALLGGLLLMGCSTQAPYMRKWLPVEGLSRRWHDGEIVSDRLSADEKAVFDELGPPDIIRFFRAFETRQPVYEWIYEAKNQIVWFVEGRRVDYVAVDTSPSKLRKDTRETIRQKAVAGGVLGSVVGGFTAGMLLLGESLGLKD